MRVVIFIKQYSSTKLESSALNSLKRVAQERRYQIVKILQADAQDMEALQRNYQLMLGLARAGLIQKVFIYKLIHLGDEPKIALERISQFKQEKVSIYIHSLDCETLSPYKVWSDSFIPIYSVLAEFVKDADRKNTSKKSIKKRRNTQANTSSSSPKPPLQASDYQLLEEYPKVVRALKQGRSIKNTAAIFGLPESLIRSIQQIIKMRHKDLQLSLSF